MIISKHILPIIFDMQDSDLTIVDVDIQPIELCKLLKIANLVGGGGEAKMLIAEGYVFLNNEVEFQKRKKVYDGDIVEFNGEVIQVNVTDTGFAPNKTEQVKSKPIRNKSKAKKVTNKSSEISVTKRKPINF